jgi:hypothetical protein
MTKFADMNPPPWETTATSGRADLRLHPLIREAYKVACLIEDCGGSPELTAASGAAFSLCEQLSDYFRQQAHVDIVRKILRACDEAVRTRGSGGTDDG